MEHIQVDLFEVDPDVKTGERYVCHIQDYFSKFGWAFAFKTKDATNYARAIVNVITTEGFPVAKIHHDNGGEFIAKVFFYWLAWLTTKRCLKKQKSCLEYKPLTLLHIILKVTVLSKGETKLLKI
jgi:transposase InsO family protein